MDVGEKGLHDGQARQMHTVKEQPYTNEFKKRNIFIPKINLFMLCPFFGVFKEDTNRVEFTVHSFLLNHFTISFPNDCH